jgi:hypothetical protein
MIAWLGKILEARRMYNLVVDPNSKCPACGARQGKLKCVTVDRSQKPNTTVMVQHTCGVCSALWYEPTILKPELWVDSEILRAKS